MRKRTLTEQPRKMSDIMKGMSEQLFRDPEVVHSSEAAHVALFFANVAWNECVGLGSDRCGVGDSVICAGSMSGRAERLNQWIGEPSVS